MPYTSTYNSMSLWSINGLVPDDMNNTFSNKNCAIIESLEKQIGKANVVSLLPTDTSIRGDVFLSDESCVLIRKELYESLSFEELVKLSVMNIKIFEGEIEKAINDELQNRGVVPQKLSLSREDQGYVKSPNSDQLINEIKEIANAYDIPQVLHFNIINGQNDYKEKFVWAKPEYDNIKIVETYFFVNFLSYLLIKYGDIIKLSIDSVLENPMNSNSMERLCQDLDRIGLDKYKEILHEYNEKIEMAINQNIFPTPEKIVESYRSGDPLTISRILENIEVKVK